MPTIAIRREIPVKPGRAPAKRCKVLAGCYETVSPVVREVYVAEQIGEIQGWSFSEWLDGAPVAVKLYVRVE